MFLGLHSHPSQQSLPFKVVQILLLISETARGDKKGKITFQPAYDQVYSELLDNDKARLPSPIMWF